jgi:hypothetical protein
MWVSDDMPEFADVRLLIEESRLWQSKEEDEHETSLAMDSKDWHAGCSTGRAPTLEVVAGAIEREFSSVLE